MLGFYMDDSADHRQQTIFTVAGFIGEGRDWFEVERAWNTRLEREGLEYFHTYDCINLTEHFKEKLVDRYGLTTARVIADAVLADLKKLVANSPIYSYSVGVLMDDYKLVAAEPDGQIVLNPSPYIFAHHLLMTLVLDDVASHLPREIVAFLYDEHSKAVELQNSWTSYKEENPNLAKSAGTLAPLDDKRHAPIQVGDLLAHSTTRFFQEFLNSPDTAKIKMMDWLGGHLQRIVYVDARWLREVVAGNVERCRKLGVRGGLVFPNEGV